MDTAQTENYKYYSNYIDHSMTTIQLSTDAKALLGSFGTKDDTYEDIVRRVCAMAAKEQLRQFLMGSENTITLEEARHRHDATWSS
ncbi:hypothetical protein AUJ68_06820 [Candidatus Woesearchaeota archaeon CG1_02_57_44]|nr:MAG: hypothetical protein AUJ68_06820 [Candidatus Woesearchaeota archaeon CG1_02_57_44]